MVLEQLSEKLKKIALVEHAQDKIRFVRRGKIKRIREEIIDSVCEGIELTDQMDYQ